MSYVEKIKSGLEQYADAEKREFLPRFFRAVPGGYGEGDIFMGVTVPLQRKIARKYYKAIPLEDVEKLLQDPLHECRLTALLVLCLRYAGARGEEDKKVLVNIYLRNLSHINNWDLVDASSDKILGAYLLDKNKDLLYTLAASGNLWQQRVAVMATFHFIRHGRCTETLELAERLLGHGHDLIHKAVGWMLREIGKRDFAVAYAFLLKHYRRMPRTMLRYAIEKFEPGLRQQFLRGML